MSIPALTHCKGTPKQTVRRPDVIGTKSAPEPAPRETPTHLGVASEEAVRDGNVDVERQRLQDVGLHGDELLPLVGVVTDVEEVVHTRRGALLRDRKNNRVDDSHDKNVTCVYLSPSHLELGGQEHGRGADELQHLPLDGGFGQVVVRHLDGHVEGLVVQLKVFLDEQNRNTEV